MEYENHLKYCFKLISGAELKELKIEIPNNIKNNVYYYLFENGILETYDFKMVTELQTQAYLQINKNKNKTTFYQNRPSYYTKVNKKGFKVCDWFVYQNDMFGKIAAYHNYDIFEIDLRENY